MPLKNRSIRKLAEIRHTRRLLRVLRNGDASRLSVVVQITYGEESRALDSSEAEALASQALLAPHTAAVQQLSWLH